MMFTDRGGVYKRGVTGPTSVDRNNAGSQNVQMKSEN